MSRLSEEQSNRGIGMLMAEDAVKDVSQAVGCTRHTLMTCNVHTGRPHATTARTDRFITSMHKYVNAFCRRRSLPDATD